MADRIETIIRRQGKPSLNQEKRHRRPIGCAGARRPDRPFAANSRDDEAYLPQD
jgi:hypothetical protein